MLATTVRLVFGNILALDDISVRGLSIAATGMLIVMLALTFISLFIAGLPRILAAVAKVYPEPVERHGKRTHPENLVADDAAVLAAIGFVLHTEFQKQVEGENAGVNKG
jgi:Na+-transporting methylmalonyl-CoA/oxaloacetate decarboxylase gamma subunit